MTRVTKFAVCLAVLVLASACASDAVVFVTATNLGVEISTGEGSQGAKVGYQRSEFVSMPLVEKGTFSGVSADDADGKGDTQGKDKQNKEVIEAYPVVAMFQMSTGSLAGDKGSLRIRQTFATGKAARGRTATAAVGAAFAAAAGGDVLIGSGQAHKNVALLELVGKPPKAGALEAVSNRLLSGNPVSVDSVKTYIDTRPAPVTLDEKESQKTNAASMDTHNLLRTLFLMASQDKRTAELEALRADLEGLN